MQASNFRFAPAHLFYTLTLVASATALFGCLGIPISAFVLLVWWQVLTGAHRERQLQLMQKENAVTTKHSHARLGTSKLELVVVLLIIGLLVGLLTPASSDSDPMRHAEISMKMVAKALREYHADNGEYPPPIIRDDAGKPMHSWRALLLPYLDEDPLAEAYLLDEPWNGPHNSKLAKYRPWHFRVYDPQLEPDPCVTSMQAIALDGQLLLLEHEATLCNWLEPQSFDASVLNRFEEIPPQDRGFWTNGFFVSSYRGRLIVSPANSFQVHPAKVNEIRQALASSSASHEQIHVGDRYWQLHYGNALHLAIFAMVALYPIRWLHRLRSRNC